MAYPTPQPLFDTIEEIGAQILVSSVKPLPRFAKKDFTCAKDFLIQYSGNAATFRAYRREVERLLAAPEGDSRYAVRDLSCV